ncbi:acyl carrier protein [Flavobacterium sp.]|jgi:acyl carrier protein|uniref:acyl carrier protein n=1 Tax=Flavobacterium sp. TaxID=239 RepID=UPI0037C1517D
MNNPINRDKIASRICEMIADVTDAHASEITPDKTLISDLFMTDVDVCYLQGDLDDEFNILTTVEQFEKAVTVNDVIDIIVSVLQTSN